MSGFDSSNVATDRLKNFEAPVSLFGQLERNASLFPGKTAIVFRERKLDYQTVLENSVSLGNHLLGLGLQPGDNVGLVMEKSPEPIIAFLGIAAAGGVAFPVDFNQPLTQIQYTLDLTRAFTLVVEEKFLPMVKALDLPFPPERLVIVRSEKGESGPGVSWETIINRVAPTRPDVTINEHDPAYLNFTSGTTGRPKGAVTTYANIYYNTLAAVESLQLNHDDVHLCMFPVFSHPHELFARPLFLGGTMVLAENIFPDSLAGLISQHRVTSMMAIASIYETFVSSKNSADYDLSSLRVPESGGMHVNGSLFQRFKDRHGRPIIPVWGSTETCGIAFATPVEGPFKPGSMGKPCPTYQAKIINEEGEELGPNEVGEMIVSGPAVCSGYLNDPEETEKSMKDGWFHTGDMARRDSDGYFFFVDRRTRMMKVAGMKVFPTEVEEVLHTHPDISEAVVVKMKDIVRGETPRAVIVLRPGAELTAREVRAFCEDRLAKYKVPRKIEFREELPRSTSGKILWRGI